jgi:hypothetical protein
MEKNNIEMKAVFSIETIIPDACALLCLQELARVLQTLIAISRLPKIKHRADSGIQGRGIRLRFSYSELSFLRNSNQFTAAVIQLN